jgi:lactocepin
MSLLYLKYSELTFNLIIGGIILEKTHGTFLEGFVVLEDPMEMNPTLSIPYMGYYGEWDKAPVIDKTIYEERSFYGLTSLAWYDEANELFEFLGVDFDGRRNTETIAFSPNKDNYRDDVLPILSFLRNAKEMELNILDESGKVIRTLFKGSNYVKNYYDSGRGNPYTASLDWIWDGTVSNKLVKDGNYFYEVKTRIDFEDAKWQSVQFPVKVDTKKPVKDLVTYDMDNEVLTVTAKDEGSGIYAYVLEINGDDPVANSTGIFDFSDVTLTKKSTVSIYDFAGNVETFDLAKELKKIIKPVNPPKPEKPEPDPVDPPAASYEEPTVILENDLDAPVVMVETPEFFETVTTSSITITGTITDDSPLEYLKIDGQDVPYTWNPSIGKWVFSHTLKLEDGYRSIRVDAMDKKGNQLDFLHKVFVDTTKPVIKVQEAPARVVKTESITLKALITDNLPDLKVTLNGNMLVNISEDWSYFDTLSPASYELDVVIPLAVGQNTIVLEAVDGAGNLTTVTYNVKRNK